jgi:hypothetical protein
MATFIWPNMNGSNGVTIYSTFSSFQNGTQAGSLAVAADTGILYEWNGSSWQVIAGPGSALSVGTFGSTPNASGASLASNTLTLQPADGTHPGGVTAGTQTLGGNKTFTGTIAASNFSGSSSGTNTGDVTIGTADGLSLSGQVLSLGLASSGVTGALSGTDWNTFNGKQAAGSYITALTGDVTASGPGSSAATLATVNSNVGSFTNASITVNGKGLITAASNGTAPVTSLTVATANGFAGTSSGGQTPALTLTTSINAPALAGNGTAISAATTTGSGSTVVLSASPTLTSPVVGTQTQGDSSTKAASTAYVDTAVANAIAGVNPATSVQAATTAASDTSGFTYNNGVSGIGATLTGAVNTAFTVDGFTFTAVNQRVLVKNDTQSPSGAFNGVYYVTQIQTSILPVVLTRALDYDAPSDINNTGSIPVINGTINGTTSWVLTTSVTTVGTSPLTYTKFTINPSTILTNPMTTGGDIIYGGSSGTPTRLANGSSGQVIKSSGGTSAPTWSNPNTVVSKTSTYTAAVTDSSVLCSSGTFTITLPAASAAIGPITVIKTDSSLSNIITVSRAGSDTLQGAGQSSVNTTTLNTIGESVMFVSDGTSVWTMIRNGTITPTIAYTPVFTGLGTVTSIHVFSRRNGDCLEVQGIFTSGTVTGSNVTMTMGFNGTSGNVSGNTNTLVQDQSLICGVGASSANSLIYGVLANNTTQTTVYISFSGASGALLGAQTGTAAFSSNAAHSISFKIPISGWNA